MSALTSERRCPSVATSEKCPAPATSRTPLRKYRVSSLVVANCVRAIISPSLAAGSVSVAVPDGCGSVGKSSAGIACILESKRSAATRTPDLSCSIRISVSGSMRMISKSFLAGSVSFPPLATDAGHWLRSATWRSVARNRSWSPSASMRTLASTGIVLFRSTIPWKSCSSRSRSLLRTTSSMAPLTSRERVGDRSGDCRQLVLKISRSETTNYIGKDIVWK